MPWVIEDLIGDLDGVNKAFSVSQTPVKPTLAVVHHGRRLRPVASIPQPGQFEFGITETDITLGDAPEAGEDLWCRYYTPPGESLMFGGGGDMAASLTAESEGGAGINGGETPPPAAPKWRTGGYGGGPFGIEE